MSTDACSDIILTSSPIECSPSGGNGGVLERSMKDDLSCLLTSIRSPAITTSNATSPERCDQPAPGRQTWIAPPAWRTSNAGCGAVARPPGTQASAVLNYPPWP